MTSLIEAAIEARPTKGRNEQKPVFSKEEIELALAWVDGIVSGSDVTRALDAQNGIKDRGTSLSASSYAFLARALKQYIQELWKQEMSKKS